ncbi:MAG: hypothetical protein EBZ44_06880 [Verrucomicrobia bacterium]|nr:hypothetical protein [Verrucomicrobiota bacterium]
MTKKEQMKEHKKQLELRRAETARKEAEVIETFRSLNIKAGDFIQVSYKSFWRIGGEHTETEIWFADPCENNHYDRKLPFLEKLMFWNLSGGYVILSSVSGYFDIKKIEATPELLERVETSKGISAGIHEAYNSGGQYKGD